MKHRALSRTPRAAALGAASLLVLLAAGQGACVAGTGGPAVSAPSSAGGLVGNPAPDFSVSPVAGARGAVSLKQLHGKVVLVDFWGTFCTPCKSSFPKLQALNAKYAGSGLRDRRHQRGRSRGQGEDPRVREHLRRQVRHRVGRGSVDSRSAISRRRCRRRSSSTRGASFVSLTSATGTATRCRSKRRSKTSWPGEDADPCDGHARKDDAANGNPPKLTVSSACAGLRPRRRSAREHGRRRFQGGGPRHDDARARRRERLSGPRERRPGARTHPARRGA